MTLDEIVTVILFIMGVVSCVTYKLTNEVKYFKYVNQKVGR